MFVRCLDFDRPLLAVNGYRGVCLCFEIFFCCAAFPDQDTNACSGNFYFLHHCFFHLLSDSLHLVWMVPGLPQHGTSRISWFRCIQAGHGIENIDIALHIAPAAEKPVDIPDVPHEKREGAGVIAGD